MEPSDVGVSHQARRGSRTHPDIPEHGRIGRSAVQGLEAGNTSPLQSEPGGGPDTELLGFGIDLSRGKVTRITGTDEDNGSPSMAPRDGVIRCQVLEFLLHPVIALEVPGEAAGQQHRIVGVRVLGYPDRPVSS